MNSQGVWNESPVCIVGAGPAGVTAALFLAKHGIECTLVDKAKFPRYRADGNGLRPRVFEILDSIDPAISRDFKTSDFQFPMLGAEFILPGEKSILAPFPQDPPQMYLARRCDFDNFLLDQAKKNDLINIIEGLELEHYRREDGQIILSDSSGTTFIKTPQAIIANGIYSKFTRTLAGHQIKPEQYAEYTRFYYKDVPGIGKNVAPTAVFIDELAPHYLFYHTTPGGILGVGIGINGKKVQEERIDLDTKLIDLLATHLPDLYKRICEGTLIHTHQHRLPYGGHPDILSGDNYMLVGDAARLCDPFTFIGTDIAMESGMLAALQAVTCIEQKDFSASIMKSYDRVINAKFQSQFQRQRVFQEFSSKPKLVKLAFKYILSDKSLHSIISHSVLQSSATKNLTQHTAYEQMRQALSY